MLVVKNPPANTGDTRETDLIPGLGRSPGVGKGSALQCSWPEDAVDGAAWQAAVPEASKNTQETTRLKETKEIRQLNAVYNSVLGPGIKKKKKTAIEDVIEINW